MKISPPSYLKYLFLGLTLVGGVFIFLFIIGMVTASPVYALTCSWQECQNVWVDTGHWEKQCQWVDTSHWECDLEKVIEYFEGGPWPCTWVSEGHQECQDVWVSSGYWLAQCTTKYETCPSNYLGPLYCEGNTIVADWYTYYCSAGGCEVKAETHYYTNCDSLDGWHNLGSSYECCSDQQTCTCQDQKYRDYYCVSGGQCLYTVTSTQTTKADCSYVDGKCGYTTPDSPPSGTLIVSPTTVETGKTITITVTGYDDRDIDRLGAHYKGSWHWQYCSGTQTSCTKYWYISESTPGTYTYHGGVWDSAGQMSYTTPNYITVIVKAAEKKVTCGESTPHFTSGCELLLHYDANDDGVISKEELVMITRDYFDGLVTKAEVDFVSKCWEVGEINNLCPGCYVDNIPPTGTLEVSPTEAKVEEKIAITITGNDNVDVAELLAWYGGSWHGYICSGVQTSCTYTWETSESSPGTYEYGGYVTDTAHNSAWTVPSSVSVKVITEIECDDPTPHFTSGCELLLHYDTNNDGVIDISENLTAVNNYFDGLITKTEVDFVNNCYTTGGINISCPDCYATLTLTVSKIGSGTVTGTGIDCGTDCSQSYPIGTTVTLTAIPDSGWDFAFWLGASPDTGTYTLTLDADKSVTAAFGEKFTLQMAAACSKEECDLLLDYDTDDNGEIEKEEALTVVTDYFDEKITKEEALLIISCYMAEGINEVCSNCFIAAAETFYSIASDGFISYQDDNYNNAHNANSGNDPVSGYIYTGQYYSSLPGYVIYRGFVFFDTSSLEGAEITAATLTLKVRNNNADQPFTIRIQNGQPNYPHDSLIAADYYYAYYSGAGGEASISSGDTSLSINLNGTGLNWLNKTGITKLCLRSVNDINANPPGALWEMVSFYAGEATGDNRPKLEVTYTAPISSPTVTTETATVSLQNDQATLKGSLADMGGADSCDVWFQWGTTTSYGNETTHTPKTSTGTFSATINLSPDTVYHFRAVADNTAAGGGISYGGDRRVVIYTASGGQMSFTTDVTLKVSKIGSGTVTGNGINCGTVCEKSYDFGTPVTLTATPDENYEFDSWSGDCSGTSTTCTLTMDSDKTVTASFNLKTRTLKVSKIGSGTVTGNDINCGTVCEKSYDFGTEVNLTATAGSGYTFGYWSGCDSTTYRACTVKMTSDKEVTVTFTPIYYPTYYTLTVNPAGTGIGTVNFNPPNVYYGLPHSASYEEGWTVTLTAKAASGSEFAGWSEGGCSGTGTCTVTMNSHKTVNATFNEIPSVIDTTPPKSTLVKIDGYPLPPVGEIFLKAGTHIFEVDDKDYPEGGVGLKPYPDGCKYYVWKCDLEGENCTPIVDNQPRNCSGTFEIEFGPGTDFPEYKDITVKIKVYSVDINNNSGEKEDGYYDERLFGLDFEGPVTQAKPWFLRQ